jgi:hypothetical protein
VIPVLLAAISQVEATPSVTMSDGKTVYIRSFDIGTENDVSRLKRSPVNLIILRFNKWTPDAKQIAIDLRTGPKGRRAVLVDFPALSVSPSNGLLWRKDWDADGNGKPDADAPSWVGSRNADGVYPLQTNNGALRSRMFGPAGLIAMVAKAGFDGIVVSALQDPNRRFGIDAKFAADLMFEGRMRKSGFVVLVRNPGKLMEYPAIRNYVDGFVADGLFFGRERMNQPSNKQFVDDSVKRLEWAIEKNKMVLSIAYTTDREQIAENNRRAEEHSFIPLIVSKRFEFSELSSR